MTMRNLANLADKLKMVTTFLVIATDNYAEDLMAVEDNQVKAEYNTMKLFRDKHVIIYWCEISKSNKDVIRGAFRAFKDVREVNTEKELELLLKGGENANQ